MMAAHQDIRLVYHADGHPWEAHIPIRPKREDCFDFVDHLAAAGVDMMSLMVFVGGQVVWRTHLATPRFTKHPTSEPGRLRLERLWQQNVEPIEAYAARCHERGIKCMAKFRMNDRHSVGKPPGFHHNIHMGKFVQDHPEWWLKDSPGGLDYSHRGVRDWMFSMAQEVTSRFDIDGLTFNYMRYPYVFEMADSCDKRQVLTQFMRRVREMLDTEGRQKGRRLDLCAIVAPTVDECLNIGLDVPIWIAEGIVDSVCPCHFDNTLFNDSYAPFTELTRGTNTRLYPTVHPGISPYLYQDTYMTPAAYRAVARNMYADGVDGISVFNYMCHWSGRLHLWGAGTTTPAQNYPKTLSWLKELRGPNRLGDRHYVYLASRDPDVPGLKNRHQVMTLKRVAGAHAEWPLRCAERFEHSVSALIRLIVRHLYPEDEVELTVNGSTVPPDCVTRTFHSDDHQPRQHGILPAPYTKLELRPTSPPFSFLSNTLGLTLSHCRRAETQNITVPEIEIAVSEGSQDPEQVMALLEAPPCPEPVPVVAGYHPHPAAISRELTAGTATDVSFCSLSSYSGNAVQPLGAQLFALPHRFRLSRVDMCIYRVPEIQERLHVDLRADHEGLPATALLAPEATAFVDPWEEAESLNTSLQGYYQFVFPETCHVGPGAVWMVLWMDSSRQPAASVRYGDPPAPSCFAPVLSTTAAKHYAQGSFWVWNGRTWQRSTRDGQPVNTFFGVFGEQV